MVLDREFPRIALDRGRFSFSGAPLRSRRRAGDGRQARNHRRARARCCWNVKSFGPAKARLLRAPEGWRASTPLVGEGGPLILALEKPGGSRHIATAFGVDETAFPLQAGFPSS